MIGLALFSLRLATLPFRLAWSLAFALARGVAALAWRAVLWPALVRPHRAAWVLATVGAVALLAAPALGQGTAATTAMDDVMRAYQAGASAWLAPLTAIARRLFVGLATLEVTVSGLLWTLRRDSLDEIAAKFLLKFIVLSLMLAVLASSTYWLGPLVNGFSAAGEAAIGGGTISPSLIIDTGGRLSGLVMGAIRFTGVTDLPGALMTALYAVAVALVIEFSYALVAAMVLLTWVEGFVALGGGVLFLGFAASRWSAAYAENFINYLVSVGVRLFLLTLVVGIGMSVTASAVLPRLTAPGALATDLSPLRAALGMAVVFAIIAVALPRTVASRVTGSHSLGLASALRAL